MNKYQEAFEIIDELSQDGPNGRKYLVKHSNAIKELVERATPKKPIKSEDYEYGLCPNCKNYHIYDYEYEVRFGHCIDCGQTLDWSTE